MPLFWAIQDSQNQVRGAVSTLSNIYDEVFWQKYLMATDCELYLEKKPPSQIFARVLNTFPGQSWTKKYRNWIIQLSIFSLSLKEEPCFNAISPCLVHAKPCGGFANWSSELIIEKNKNTIKLKHRVILEKLKILHDKFVVVSFDMAISFWTVMLSARDTMLTFWSVKLVWIMLIK